MNPIVILWIAVLGGLFWFTIIRPQRRQRQRAASLKRSLAPGEQVITVGGIHGTLISIDDTEARVEIAPEVVVTVAVRAIAGRAAPVDDDDVYVDDDAEELEPEDEAEDDGLQPPRDGDEEHGASR